MQYSHSLVPRPLPVFQCCMLRFNIENWEWPGDEASTVMCGAVEMIQCSSSQPPQIEYAHVATCGAVQK